MIRRSALVLLGLTAGLVLAELVLRLARPVPTNDLLPFSYQANLRLAVAGGAYVRFDQALGWVPPREPVHRRRGVAYTINRARIRGARGYPSQRAHRLGPLAAFGG